MIHHFQLQTTWTGGRNDSATIHAGNLQTAVSIPKNMGGPGIGTNPDEMLLGAAATCYIITLAAMLERSGIDAQIDLQSHAQVDVTNGVFTYKRITHMPTITLAVKTEARKRDVAQRYAQKAEETCMISKALRGNVDIDVRAIVTVRDELEERGFIE